MYAVGESFIEGTKVWSPYYNTIGITVNSVQVQKDFTGVTTDSIGREADFSQYLEEDGKLADGISVVVVDMTYQNVGQDYIEWDRVCVCPDLYYLHNEDGVYQCYSKMAGFRNTRYHDLAYDAGMFSFATDEDKGYKNGLGDLQPGQKRPAQVAFLVKDENLANMYLTINAYGNSDSVGYTFDQYVYIGQ